MNKYYRFYFSDENLLSLTDSRDLVSMLDTLFPELKYELQLGSIIEQDEDNNFFDLFDLFASKKVMQFVQVFLMGKGYNPTIEYHTRTEYESIHIGEVTFN